MNAWHDKRDGQWLEAAPAGNIRFVEKWLLRQKQMVEDYRPDLMYFDDTGVPFGADGARGGGSLLQPGGEMARRGGCRSVRQEAGGRATARNRRRRRARLRRRDHGPSRGRPTPASATGITTAGSTRTAATRARSRSFSGSPTSCRRTATCCSTCPSAATARSTRRKKRSSTRSPRGRAQRRSDLRHAAVAEVRRGADKASDRQAMSRTLSRSPPRTCASRKGDTLYAIFLEWPPGESAIPRWARTRLTQ